MAYWSGDNNNPNRDLSDPSWVSVEGARAMRNIHRSHSSSNIEKKICKHEKIKIIHTCSKCLKVVKIE